MEYKDGKTYDFVLGESIVHVRLKNFRPEVIQTFNKVRAKELMRCYREQENKERRCIG